MRPIQNADGHVGLTARSYPIAANTNIAFGQLVKLSSGAIAAAANAETGALVGVAAEDHPGAADALNPRANGTEIFVCDNPGLIFECPVPTFSAASGSATTIVPASGEIDAGAADDTYNGSTVVLKKKAAGSTNTDAVGVHRAVSDYAKTGTILTVASGGTPSSGDVYELYPALGSAVCALSSAEKLVITGTGATSVRVVGHDYERHMLHCMASLHTLAVEQYG